VVAAVMFGSVECALDVGLADLGLGALCLYLRPVQLLMKGTRRRRRKNVPDPRFQGAVPPLSSTL
jgi:hypothetical protein